MQAPTVNIEFPEWSQSMFQEDWGSLFLRGGRWSLKSYTTVHYLLLESYQNGDILCARDFKSSTKASSYELFCQRIAYYNLTDFDVQSNEIINRVSGTKIQFVGLERMADSIRSRPNVRIFWIEEAHAIKVLKDITDARTSIRPDQGRRKFIATWNPQHDDTPIELLRAAAGPRTLDIFVTYKDAPEGWLSEDFYEDYADNERLYADQPGMLEHIYDGEFLPLGSMNPFGATAIAAAISRENIITAEPETVVGVDLAYTDGPDSDWTACVKLDAAGNEIAALRFKQVDYKKRTETIAEFIGDSFFTILEYNLGQRDTVLDLAREHGISGVTGVNVVGSRSTDRSVSKYDLVHYAAKRLADGNATLRSPELISEIKKYTLTEAGKYEAESGNDDMVSAWMLAFEALRRKGW